MALRPGKKVSRCQIIQQHSQEGRSSTGGLVAVVV